MTRSNGFAARPSPRSALTAGGLLSLAGGILSILGSASTWGTCPQDPCNAESVGLQVVLERTGLQLGFGIVSLLLGVLVLATVLLTSRRSVPIARGRVLLLAGAGIVAAVVADILFYYVIDQETLVGRPWLGVYVTGIGGALVIAGSLLFRRRPAEPVPQTRSTT